MRRCLHLVDKISIILTDQPPHVLLMMMVLIQNQRDQSSGSGVFAEMHASKLLKGVLKPRTLNSTTANDQASNSTSNTSDASGAGTARGKRAFNPDNTISSTTLTPKKIITVPERTACLCAPTKHAGSFRCRLHRVSQKHWGGRLLKLQQSSTTSCNASTSASTLQLPDGSARPKATMPHAPTPGSLSMSRPGATRLSRLRTVVVATHAENVADHPDAVDDSTAQMLGESVFSPSTYPSLHLSL